MSIEYDRIGSGKCGCGDVERGNGEWKGSLVYVCKCVWEGGKVWCGRMDGILLRALVVSRVHWLAYCTGEDLVGVYGG